MADRPPRPQALTLTCIFVGVGSALLLVNLVSTLSSWGSIELQDAVREALATEPLKEAGIGLDQALDALRYAAYVGVVLTASGAVFALYAARGHRTSRIMLTILCGLAFLVFAAIGLPGLLPAAFAGVCGWSLWTAESRRWFDQVNGRAVPALATATRTGAADPFAAVPPSSTPQAGAPAAFPSVGEQSATPAPTHPVPSRPASAARPRSVTVAVVTTVVSCAVVGFFGLIALLVSTIGADAYRSALSEPGMAQDWLRSAGVDADQVIGLLRLSSTVWLVLSAVGLAAAIATAKRMSAGVVALRIVAALTVGVSVFFLPLGIVTAAAAVVVVVQLRRPDARAWLARA